MTRWKASTRVWHEPQPRRIDHMQQHTGQHLLSAVLERLFSAKTVSFHLGTDASTIDLARELSPHTRRSQQAAMFNPPPMQ